MPCMILHDCFGWLFFFIHFLFSLFYNQTLKNNSYLKPWHQTSRVSLPMHVMRLQNSSGFDDQPFLLPTTYELFSFNWLVLPAALHSDRLVEACGRWQHTFCILYFRLLRMCPLHTWSSTLSPSQLYVSFKGNLSPAARAALHLISCTSTFADPWLVHARTELSCDVHWDSHRQPITSVTRLLYLSRC